MSVSLDDESYAIRTTLAETRAIGTEPTVDLTLLEDIAAEAYGLFLARGCEHGHDVEDWLAAEEIVSRRRAEAAGNDSSPLHLVVGAGPRDEPDGVGEPDEPEEGIPDEDEDEDSDVGNGAARAS